MMRARLANSVQAAYMFHTNLEMIIMSEESTLYCGSTMSCTHGTCIMYLAHRLRAHTSTDSSRKVVDFVTAWH